MKTVINITRHRHTYLHTITRDGVQGTPAAIDWQRAVDIVLAHCDGQLPAECNFDVCQPRRWSWEIELEAETAVS